MTNRMTRERLVWKESVGNDGKTCYIATMAYGISYTAFKKGRAWMVTVWVRPSAVGYNIGPYKSLDGAKRAAARAARM